MFCVIRVGFTNQPKVKGAYACVCGGGGGLSYDEQCSFDL